MKRFTVLLPLSLWSRVQAAAESEGLTVSAWIKRVVTLALG